MPIISRGTVRDGTIELPERLALPDGTEVTVSFDRPELTPDTDAEARIHAFEALGFHGMWADREDMADSVAWVRQLRRQWQQRRSRNAWLTRISSLTTHAAWRPRRHFSGA